MSTKCLPLLFSLLLLVGCGPEPAPPVAAAPSATVSASETPAVVASETSAALAAATRAAFTATPKSSATPASTATPKKTATPEATATPEGLSEAQLAELRPNEMGWIPVLEYHLFEGENGAYSRTPASFRADLELLYAHNFYPIRFRDLAAGTIDIPVGKSPVVLTFDDSSDGQFRYLDEATVDPNSAMGILLAFSEEHPDFPPIATFFPLIEVDVPERILFGQPEYAQRKLQEIVAWGGEVGSHTYSHERLDRAEPERIRWQLAFSSQELEELIGDGYEITSLSLPFGIYPGDESLIHSGEAEGVSYEFAAAAEVDGGNSVSPYSTEFDPYHIARIQVQPDRIERIFALFDQRPTLPYVSDGDATTITVPSEETLDVEQQGVFNESRFEGMTIRRYDRAVSHKDD
ncbi:MAG: polysaccharide deacetylase family protein [Ardenticatenales bacterium]|nr:polysaccharide deacetylase family protein [Ardenticatenales bacterium]